MSDGINDRREDRKAAERMINLVECANCGRKLEGDEVATFPEDENLCELCSVKLSLEVRTAEREDLKKDLADSQRLVFVLQRQAEDMRKDIESHRALSEERRLQLENRTARVKLLVFGIDAALYSIGCMLPDDEAKVVDDLELVRGILQRAKREPTAEEMKSPGSDPGPGVQ